MMARTDPTDGPEVTDDTSPSFWHRVKFGTLHRDEGEGRSLGTRLRDAVRKPVEPGSADAGGPTGADRTMAVAELEKSEYRADDKERLVGYVAAPLAAAIAFLVTGSLIGNDPARLLSDGQVNPHYVSPSLYLTVGGVAMVLALLMLVMAWRRQRLYLGLVMALYGLSIFNLHFWGFGLPYVMGGAWFLVRSYRAHSGVKEARAAEVSGLASRSTSNKRYTPPSSTDRTPRRRAARKAG